MKKKFLVVVAIAVVAVALAGCGYRQLASEEREWPVDVEGLCRQVEASTLPTGAPDFESGGDEAVQTGIYGRI